MEGHENDSKYPSGDYMYPEEEQKDFIEDRDREPEIVKERKNGKKLPLIMGIIIGLVVGVIISPYILGLDIEDKSEPPIWKQYEKFEGEYTKVYKNEKLNVTVTRDTSTNEYSRYKAEWIDIDGHESYEYNEDIKGLYDDVLNYAEELSENQLKWFEYICMKVIK